MDTEPRMAFLNGVAYFEGQAPGALANGSRVRKVNSEAGDGHPDGSLGTIISSVSYPEVYAGTVLYFVMWAGTNVPVATIETKVEKP